MSRKKNLRRVSVLVTPQTLYNLERLADLAGYGQIGKVIDKLTRDHMLALSRAARLPDKPPGGAPVTGRELESQETALEFLRRGRKGFYPSAIRTCEGDLFLICDALEDYADICEQYIERERDKLTAYQVGAIECRIERYRYIAGKYAAAIGYDREKALARCAKRRATEGRENVGEEALSALVRYGTENGKKNRRKA